MKYVITMEEINASQQKETLRWKNDFESTDSGYVNTNRKYSLGNFLELEAIDLIDLESCNTVVSGKQMKNTVWQKKQQPTSQTLKQNTT